MAINSEAARGTFCLRTKARRIGQRYQLVRAQSYMSQLIALRQKALIWPIINIGQFAKLDAFGGGPAYVTDRINRLKANPFGAINLLGPTQAQPAELIGSRPTLIAPINQRFAQGEPNFPDRLFLGRPTGPK